jgi:hypothetical protein
MGPRCPALSLLPRLRVGALGNLLGVAIRGTTLVWDVSVTQCLYYVLGMVLSLLIGFMLDILIRSSNGAILAYFILTFLLPTCSACLPKASSGSTTFSLGSTSSSPKPDCLSSSIP